MREIVLEQSGTDANGTPQYSEAKPISPIIGQLIAYGLFFFALAFSGA